jgi:hypothetical protein
LLTYELRIPKDADEKRVVRLIERLCAEEDLDRNVKRTSRTYPGSVHWHYGRRNSPGTLDVTFWPMGAKIWLSVHSNREANWTHGSIKRLSKAIEKELGKRRKGSIKVTERYDYNTRHQRKVNGPKHQT